MAFFNTLTSSKFFAVLLLARLRLSVSKNNYGVYFNESGPFPYGNNDPEATGDPTDAKPPGKWDRVDEEFYPYDWSKFFDNEYRYKSNKCKEDKALLDCGDVCDYEDGHEQSPIQVQYDNRVAECDDRHSFHHPIDGTCKDGEIDFKVTPSGLWANLNCTERPELDFSKNRDAWEMRAIEVKVPAEHEHKLGDGTVLKFDAELQMVHTGTGGKDDNFAIVAVWLQGTGTVKNAEIEKYIVKWEEALDMQYQQCNKTYDEVFCDIEDGYQSFQTKSFGNMTEWERITFDNFESGTERHFASDSKNALVSKYEEYTSSGVKACRLRAGTDDATLTHKIDHDISGFTAFQVSFHVYAKNVQRGDAFALEFSPDGGNSFFEVKTWTVSEDIQVVDKEGVSDESVTFTQDDISSPLTNTGRLRFRSLAKSASRRFYIDDINFLGNADSIVLDLATPDFPSNVTEICTAEVTSLCCTAMTPNNNDTVSQDVIETWEIITEDDFEDGWGNFVQSGTTINNNAMRSGFGDNCDSALKKKCVRLRSGRNEPGSFEHLHDLDVTGYTELEVSFMLKVKNLDDNDDDDGFALDYSSDGGTSWTEIESWTLPQNLTNRIQTEELITVRPEDVGNFTATTRLRFRGDTTSKYDNVFIDNIVFLGLTDPLAVCNQDVEDSCCQVRRLNEKSFSNFRGASSNTADVSLAGSNKDEMGKRVPQSARFRSLEDDGFNGYLCNGDDHFCVYNLFRQTAVPYYHRYYGSLTYPPCTEKVAWRVLVEPLIISPGQLHRLEMLTTKNLEFPKCGLHTWGKPRNDGSCKVDVNRPVQYLSEDHKVEDCQENHEDGPWVFESVGLSVDETKDDAGNSTSHDGYES